MSVHKDMNPFTLLPDDVLNHFLELLNNNYKKL